MGPACVLSCRSLWGPLGFRSLPVRDPMCKRATNGSQSRPEVGCADRTQCPSVPSFLHDCYEFGHPGRVCLLAFSSLVWFHQIHGSFCFGKLFRQLTAGSSISVSDQRGVCGMSFTDGTCSTPEVAEEALASWAVVRANRGVVSAGNLPGLQQCIYRAELTAVLSAINWSACSVGDLHVWCDNQAVVDNFRKLLAGTARADEFEHQDLWEAVQACLSVSLATVHIHKVAGHDQADFSDGPIDDFCRIWNAAADRQAKVSNKQWPQFFVGVRDRFFAFRDCWKFRVGLLTNYHVAIAELDC